MYIFDSNIFFTLGYYYPSRFPTIWARIDQLAEEGILQSVREVRNEIETNCPFEHIEKWVENHHKIFLLPTEGEYETVAQIFQEEQFRGLVKHNNLIKGLPVADPFIVAAAKAYDAFVVTQESLKPGGARVPTLCQKLGVKCMNLENFLENENLQY